MDILSNYEQQNSQARAVRQPPYGSAALSEAFLVRMVIKLSGGKIQDRRTILVILLIFAGIIFVVSAFVFFQSTGVTKHPLINAPPPESIGKGSTAQ